MYSTLNYQPLEDNLTQKRKIYAKILESGMQPRSTEMISGIAVPNSKTQGFSDILKVGIGSWLSNDTEKKLQDIKTQKAIQKAQIFGKMMNLPTQDILALDGADPKITNNLFKNYLKNKELTKSQKNALASGYDNQGNPYNPLTFNIDSNNKKFTATQKDAYSSGGLSPLEYNKSFENYKFNNNRVLQDDAQEYGLEKQDRGLGNQRYMQNNKFAYDRILQDDAQEYGLEKQDRGLGNQRYMQNNKFAYDRILQNDRHQYGFDRQNRDFNFKDANREDTQAYGFDRQNRDFNFKDANREDTQNFNAQENNKNRQNRIDTTVIDADYYDPVTGDHVIKKVPIKTILNNSVQQNVSDDVAQNNQDIIKNGGGLMGDIYGNTPVKPNNGLQYGKRVISPKTTEERKFAQKRLNEKAKNLEEFENSIQSLIEAEKILKEGQLNTGFGAGVKQWWDRASPIWGNKEEAENTETYETLMNKIAGQKLKMFGGNDSEKELDFAKRISGSVLDMQPETLQNIINDTKREYETTRKNYETDQSNYEQGIYTPRKNFKQIDDLAVYGEIEPEIAPVSPRKNFKSIPNSDNNLKSLSNDDLLRELYK